MSTKESIDERFKGASKDVLMRKHFDNLTVMTNALIEALFIPEIDYDEGRLFFCQDLTRFEKFGVDPDNEPVRWERTYCLNVTMLKDTYVVTVGEAEPEELPNFLCIY